MASLLSAIKKRVQDPLWAVLQEHQHGVQQWQNLAEDKQLLGQLLVHTALYESRMAHNECSIYKKTLGWSQSRVTRSTQGSFQMGLNKPEKISSDGKGDAGCSAAGMWHLSPPLVLQHCLSSRGMSLRHREVFCGLQGVDIVLVAPITLVMRRA